MENPLEYYKSNNAMSSPGARTAEFNSLPRDVGSLCEVIQGNLLHVDIGPFAYGVKFSEERQQDRHIRPIAEMLERIRELDGRPLTAAREPNQRIASVCRHFSLMLCSMLREQGVSARARCGFGAYFTPGKFEDHWVCEYWNSAQSRWILVDAQIDDTHRKMLKPDFDPMDVPHNRFIIAGDAWQMCRSGRAEASRFGLTHVNLQGLWFVAGNVVRDLASLNRMEMLPWDVWGLMAMTDAEISEDKRKLLDEVAALTLADDDAFPQVRKVYESDDRLRVPPVVFNALRNAPEKIGF